MSEETRQSGQEPRKVYIRTLGCQMNDYDSEVVAGMFERDGWILTDREDEANVVILNTCSVRQHAEDRVWGKIFALKSRASRETGLIIAVCGCMAQARAKEISRRCPWVRVICGTRAFDRLPELVERASGQRVPVIDIGTDREPRTSGLPRKRKDRLKAFVAIMRGCENYCAYCVVPYVRGPEVSRLPGEIVAEVEGLARDGCREVMLLGQNVNSYSSAGVRDQLGGGFSPPTPTLPSTGSGQAPLKGGGGKGNELPLKGGEGKGNELPLKGGEGKGYEPPMSDPLSAGVSFAGLLRKIGGVEGILRIRFMTSHPKDFPDELLAAMAEVPQVCPHLHLPLQAGSDRILALMNRGYTLAQYRSLVKRLRGAIPGLALTTDLMAGFPGETGEEFSETLRALEEIRFDGAFIFKYSDREGTRAMELSPKVPGDEIIRRHAALLLAQEAINAEKNLAMVGARVEVLVEGVSPRDPGRLFGRTGTNRRTAFSGSPDLIGTLTCVTIREATALTLIGDAAEAAGGDHA